MNAGTYRFEDVDGNVITFDLDPEGTVSSVRTELVTVGDLIDLDREDDDR